MLRINAGLVNGSIGLPDSWWDVTGYLFDSREEIDQVHEYFIDVSHPQTAFGLAMKLDEWEAARDADWFRGDSWVSRVLVDLFHHGGETDGHRFEMIARIEQIGREGGDDGQG